MLLASAPFLVAAPAQAASQGDFPCAVGLQKVDSGLTSAVTLSVQCSETQTVAVRITADGTELLSLQEAVQVNVRQTVTVTMPSLPKVCATLQANDRTTTICTP
ncbi:hypothetical protein [Streptomyces cellulosae]|uniref:Uncharacterized protein n=1 Tax=Streptomyces cellulosae TaxID=1968 RepID=A0ABW7Y8A4_STRCE